MGEINRINQPVVAPNDPVNLQPASEVEAKKAGLSYSGENTSSINSDSKYNALQGGKQIPVLPNPASFSSPAEGKDIEAMKQFLNQAVDRSKSAIQKNNPDLISQDVEKSFSQIKEDINALTTDDEQKGRAIQEGLGKLMDASNNPALTADELSTILAEIKAKQGDNKQKTNEEKIKLGAVDKEIKSQDKIDKMKESIEKNDEAQSKTAGLGGLFGNKGGFGELSIGEKIGFVCLCVFVPWVGLWELGNLAANEITGEDQGLSLMSSPQARSKRMESIIGADNTRSLEKVFGVAPKDDNKKKETKEEGVERMSTDGLSLASTGLSRIEMLQMLQEAKKEADEERKLQKLADAIQAVQSGQPDEAIAILEGAGMNDLADKLSALNTPLGINDPTGKGGDAVHDQQKSFNEVETKTEEYRQEMNNQKGSVQKHNKV